MKTRWSAAVAIGLAAAAICATGTLVYAQAKKKPAGKPAAQSAKPMSLDEAKRLTTQYPNYTRPPRSIDDIANILDQHKPDPARIKKLQEIADKAAPASLKGMALADFLFERSSAARDLGRTQQRLADIREAFRLSKTRAQYRRPIWVADFPTPNNPNGSAAFQAFVNAKRAARMSAGGGPQRGNIDTSSMTPQERQRFLARQGMQGGGRPGGGGPGPGMAGKTNLDFMPKSPEEARARFQGQVPAETQRAIRIVQALVSAEADAGNFKNATEIWEEMRGNIVITMTPPALSTDARTVGIRLRSGDVDGARRVAGRVQQLGNLFRAHPWAWPMLSSITASTEVAFGEIAFATGKLGEAETRFRSAMKAYEQTIKDGPRTPSAPPPGTSEAHVAATRLLLAHALYRQSKLIESELEVRRALVDFLRLQGVDGPKTAHTVLILADVLQAQGRYKDAQKLAEMALDIYVRGGVHTTLHPEAYQRIAVAQASQGQWKQAMATYDRLKAAVADDPVARQRYYDTNLDLAVALLRGGQSAQAIPILEDVIKKKTASGEGEYAVAEATGFLGAAYAASGRDAEALASLRAVMPLLLSADNAAAREEGQVDQVQRRQAIVDSYFVLLTRVRGTDLEKTAGIDAADEAFRMADIARAKSVHSAIAATSARAASGDAALTELIRQTQDSDQQLAAMSGMLKSILDGAADQQDQKAIAQLRSDMGRLQQARKTLRSEIERRFPQYAQLINPKPVGIAETRARLQDGEVLVSTYFTGGKGYVWAVPKDGAVAFAAAAASEAEITQLVDRVHRSVNAEAASISEIPAFDVGVAHSLYAALLEPVAAGWRNAKDMVVVPHGTLGRLPFSLLVTKATTQPEEKPDAPRFAGYREVPFLIRDVAVTHVPSVTAFVSLRSVPPAAAGRKPFIGFGDPWFSKEQAEAALRSQEEAKIQLASAAAPIVMRAAPKTQGLPSAELAQLPRLPDTATEVREIARALGADPDADVILGTKASEKAVRSMKLDDRRVVMFATHGLIPGELDGLNEPALALASPEIRGVEGDGLLTVDKILSLKLDADWVVLSACNTAAGEGGGAEAVSGLGRAFFYAGARALLVTHWPVETVSARKLTTDLFRRQAASQSLSRAAALREAAVEMIGKGEHTDDTGKPLFVYSHPLFWAPFALIGDGTNR
jgi:CHAT domain-containing protein/tetratricopeptide (TPR) repeat protein